MASRSKRQRQEKMKKNNITRMSSLFLLYRQQLPNCEPLSLLLLGSPLFGVYLPTKNLGMAHRPKGPLEIKEGSSLTFYESQRREFVVVVSWPLLCYYIFFSAVLSTYYSSHFTHALVTGIPL